MVVAAFIGFVALFLIGCGFLLVGGQIFLWDCYCGDPSIGSIVLLVVGMAICAAAFCIAPFSITIGVTT